MVIANKKTISRIRGLLKGWAVNKQSQHKLAFAFFFRWAKNYSLITVGAPSETQVAKVSETFHSWPA
jgi:hypothetical protein